MKFINFNESMMKELGELPACKNFCVYSRCGLGDLFILKDFISSHQPPFSSTHIVFSKKPIQTRSQQITGFQSFLESFCGILFKDIANVKFYIDTCSGTFSDKTHEGPFLRTVSSREPDYSSSYVFNKIKMNSQKPLFESSFPELPKNLESLDYISLNTRFRLNPGDLNNSIIDTIKLLCKFNKPLVLIGGNSQTSFESKSLYDLYINNIPAELLVDLTTNQLDINSFLLDALIQSRSFFNFNFGIGGNLVSSTYFNKSTICLTHENHDFLSSCKTHGYNIFFNIKDCHQYFNSQLF